MTDALGALRNSVDRLGGLVRPLTDDDVIKQAYPSAWSIADVLSHVGSSAVIFERRLDDSLAGRETPPEFAEGVWAEWDHKSPRAKADDGVATDGTFMRRLESIGPDDRARVSVSLGPVTFGWDEVVRARLNEHLLHEWDVAVSLDPTATLAPEGVALVIDNLDLIGRYTAQPVAPEGTITIATSEPDRAFAVTVETKTVDFSVLDAVSDPTLTMPAEAFIRLVYGRLDVEHTPSSVAGDRQALEQLREVFPGP
ncbi:MAG TPA: maleylpyruvate isomerase family mycothiol-dependent enzyme [Acidimicrobiales bacterium]|nr:maleylpyruvate isomerase family mycothiol-dependent enzyme [Acidimicrobiales bacterium]